MVIETREYDLNRNLAAVIDRNGNRIDFTYDAANQLTRISKPEEDVTFAYNALSSITAASDQVAALALNYDGLNRLIKVITSHVPAATMQYAYDSAGNVIQTSGPHGTVLTPRDFLNRVSEVQAISGSIYDKFIMGYDAAGQRTSSYHQLTALREDRKYDAAHRLTQWLNNKGSALILSQFDYTYDRAGNRTGMKDSFGTHSYSYDLLYRLLGVNDPLEVFAYDKAGNRLSSVELQENPLDPTHPIQVPVEYTYNENNQLTSITKDGQSFATFTYDNNGNMLTKIVGDETTTYTWDSENRLIKVETPAGAVEFAYDPFGRRIEKKTPAETTRYLYDREDIVAEYDANNVLQASYIHGPGIDEPLQMKRGGVTYFYQRDASGSIASLSDNTGNKLKTYRYDSFGKIIAETGIVENPYTYTGREKDAETGLYYYRARYYDPQLGRFISEDPIGFTGGSNFYAYVGNSPVNLVDPYGLLSADWHFRVTFWAAMNSGQGAWESAKLAWGSAAVDFGSQGSSPSDTVQHAMAGEISPNVWQAPTRAIDATNAYIQSNIGQGNLLNAIHAAQDLATPAHAGQEWRGFDLLKWETYKHALGDEFPSWNTINQTYQNTKDILNVNNCSK